MNFSRLVALYDDYVDHYRLSNGNLPEMMQLKRVHTAMVVDNARKIAKGEAFLQDESDVSEAAALLHDVGRYEQLRIYNTFKDSESVDHAVFSRDIVKSLRWLEDSTVRCPEDFYSPILSAILFHNRREVPNDMSSLTANAVHTVRDADKLDIFRVLEHQVATSDWRNSTAFWHLKVEAPPSPGVVGAIESRLPVDYQEIKSLADFVLIQIGWMISGLHFATSRKICFERGHLAYRRGFLHELTDDASIDRICDLAEAVCN